MFITVHNLGGNSTSISMHILTSLLPVIVFGLFAIISLSARACVCVCVCVCVYVSISLIFIIIIMLYHNYTRVVPKVMSNTFL